MSVAEIAERLSDPLAIVAARGAAAQQPAHRSTGAISLLQESEQRLLRRLAVFGEDFGLDDVEAVCGLDDISATRPCAAAGPSGLPIAGARRGEGLESEVF